MPKEIERKFLVNSDEWRNHSVKRLSFRQGYLSTRPTVRIRVQGNELAWLTIKGKATGISRDEYEYEIPADEALAMLELCTSSIEKTRHTFPAGDGLKWEVDEFHGVNEGLVVAEIELESEGQEFDHPAWLGDEVSHDHRYSNSALAVKPWGEWIQDG